MKLSTVFFFIACVSAAFGQPNSAFYVATTGNDSNPGTQSAPWRTVQHAADTARAGSIVNVRGGIYEELVSINTSGNASDGFVTLRSYPGETAVLDATHSTHSGRQAVLTIHNQSYIRIEGFEIRNFRTAVHRLSPLGISVMGSGSHIELLKNNVHHIEQTFDGRDAPGHGDNGFGIAVYGTDAKSPITDLIIDGNEVHHLKTGSSESLVVNGNVTNFRITHNVVHDNNNIGIDVIGFERTAPDPAVDQARDILAEVLPAAKKRGMKVICWLEDVFRTDLPNIQMVQERDLYGRNAETLCVNNPDYRNFFTGLVEDYTRSYDIDGIMWGSERQGALSDSLGATHDTPPIDPGNVTCFCEFCQAKAKERGINVDRARQGFLELEKFVRSARSGKRPVDGYYVQFWRILLRYPEVAAWEMLFTDGLRETYAAIYKTVKTAKPAVPVGWHIWHNNSFNPIYRAEQDLHELSNYSDFIKVVMYNNCGGERMALYADNITSTLYGDLSKQALLDMNYALMKFKEGSYDQIPHTGLSSDYVYRETKRALEGVAGANTRILPGIDIDIPTEPNNSKSTPQSVKAAVTAAFRAGAPGVLLSRKYSEMRLANLSGAGDAIHELKS